MRLAHVTDAARPAALVDGKVLYLDDTLGVGSLDDLIAGGRLMLERARGLIDSGEAALEPDPGSRQAPLLAPAKIVCVGLNYRDHARESGAELPEHPLLFAKLANTIHAPGAAVSWDPELTAQVDWEVELAVVVGERMSRVDPEPALAGVFGYTVANDLSARDLQFGDGQWTRGKSLDGFCPLGPELVTANELGDPRACAVSARVNGETMQDSSTAEMVFGVGEILSFISRGCTLEPGDLVLTGTPWGVGAFRDPPRFLSPGDVVEVEVERIGTLATPIAAWA
jgi:2-keto-4-pentenoate hydratase/2-oxohepta-3-ene-1,7-dioic acid hydratase in catechol pathway